MTLWRTMFVEFLSSCATLWALLSKLSWPAILLITLILYVLTCSLLRFRSLRSMKSRFNFPDRASLAQMTGSEAQAIIEHAYTYEFPLFFGLSLAYAQMKLHGAVARMNYLHGPYIRSGKIQNEDLLYVLYAAMSEPVRFIRLYEWRELSMFEIAAQGTLWKMVGDMMGINYTEALGKDNWKDGLEFMEQVEQWALHYETDRLRPSHPSRQLANAQLDLLTSIFPSFMRSLMRQMGLVMMGDKMRCSFGFPEPSTAISALTLTLLWLRQIMMRFFMPPRLTSRRYVTDPDPITGRMYSTHYVKEPWYNRPTTWARWGPAAWATWVFGGMLPGDGGQEMKPDGFLFEDIGPKAKMGLGAEETRNIQEVVHAAAMASGRCPFALKE
ncbi:Mycophenolic acid synthesis protein B [Metarhizium anisopliae]